MQYSYINIFFQFSLLQFSHISRLLLVHGRNSYKRSASLSQFVIHRGLIITTMQAIFSAVFYFSSISLYQGFLMVGYATVYTMFPVFSLVLDKDVSFPFGQCTQLSTIWLVHYPKEKKILFLNQFCLIIFKFFGIIKVLKLWCYNIKLFFLDHWTDSTYIS